MFDIVTADLFMACFCMSPCSPDYIIISYEMPGARGAIILSSGPSRYTFRNPGALALRLRLGSGLSQREFPRFHPVISAKSPLHGAPMNPPSPSMPPWHPG